MKKLSTILVAFTLVSCGHSTPNESDAKEAARAAIIHNLKDPSSANFHQDEAIQNLGNNTFLYTETVNGTNGFGGSVAQKAQVKVHWNGNDPSEVTSWSVVEMNMTDR